MVNIFHVKDSSCYHLLAKLSSKLLALSISIHVLIDKHEKRSGNSIENGEATYSSKIFHIFNIVLLYSEKILCL